MIFLPDSIALIEAGIKTQTRRPRKGGEQLIRGADGTGVYAAGRFKWNTGRTYSVCPGRGKRAVGRILLTGIRLERVSDISDADAIAEGIVRDGDRWRYGDRLLCFCDQTDPEMGAPASVAYQQLWRSLYPKSDCTELCWVLTFEKVKP